MEVKTYLAPSMREALALVRRDLGSEAAVLRTREVRGRGFWGLLRRSRLIEVTASSTVKVPSRLTARQRPAPVEPVLQPVAGPAPTTNIAAAPRSGRDSINATSRLQEDMRGRLNELESLVDSLYRRTAGSTRPELPDSLFRLFTDLIDADLSEEVARELLERARQEASPEELAEPELVKNRIAQVIQQEVRVGGPIQLTPGRRRLVALVGPTGVGKTTTIAKLAANYRLKEKRRVGLITVDTYRIAAVEQLRTYADIIDLPMEVVSTPRELRQAVARLEDLDLVLMDTAGRSPADEVRIQELKSMLAEARPDEVHLVLSSVASSSGLSKTAERFAEVGVTALLLTKLDEASSLGNLLPLLRTSTLPLSYLTDGQNVPEDIAPADSRRLARVMLGLEKVSRR
jgi:flagellar biosynthesis protein FlhF